MRKQPAVATKMILILLLMSVPGVGHADDCRDEYRAGVNDCRRYSRGDKESFEGCRDHQRDHLADCRDSRRERPQIYSPQQAPGLIPIPQPQIYVLPGLH